MELVRVLNFVAESRTKRGVVLDQSAWPFAFGSEPAAGLRVCSAGLTRGPAMSRAGSTLLVLAVSLCVVSSAEARKWRWWHFYGFYVHGSPARSGDDGRRTHPANATAPARTGGAFGPVIDRLIRGCQQQAGEFQNWPFDAITQIVSPDDAQRSALEALRVSATTAAERFSTECPQDGPGPPGARLEAVAQAINTTTSIFAAVEPPLRAFYAALDDEQKARLLRDLTLSGPQAQHSDRAAERSERRSRRRGAGAARGGESNFWTGICEHFATALRGWPIRKIEHGVRLTEPQRIAFYELVTSSLKVADTLAEACPAETALTPPARMALMRARLTAVGQATAAIRPAFTRFYETLDQGQKVRFAGMR